MMTDPPENNQSNLLIQLSAWGPAMLALALYLRTLAPTVLDADSGEFQFVAWLPGIAHPTGYPLYVLLGWLWSHLWPVGEVAWRMNLLSAVLAAATVRVIWSLSRDLLRQALPETPFQAQTITASVTALIFATTATFWSQAIIAEVYALHAFLITIILSLTLKLRKNFDLQRGAAKTLTFTVGLALAHHRTVVLLLPALLLFLYQQPKTTPKLNSQPGRWWLTHTLLLLGPLLLYLYLPLIAPVTPYASFSLSDSQTLTLYENSLRGFWQHLMGTVFTGDLHPAAAGWERLALVGQLARQQVGWVGLILAGLGLAILIRRKHTDLLLLTGLGGLAFVIFNLIYFIGDVFVLFIPVWLILCLWLGLGGLGLANNLARYVTDRKRSAKETPIFGPMAYRLETNIYRLLVIGLVVVGFMYPIVLLTTRINLVDQSQNFIARQRWQTILAEPLPQQAVLVTNDRNEIMSLWYTQYVEGQRPDLLGLFPLIVPDPAYANVGRVLEQALASPRPVYLIKPMAGLSLKAQLKPVGALVQAIPYQTPATFPLAITLPEIRLTDGAGATSPEQIDLVGYDLSSTTVKPSQTVTVTLHWQVVDPLTVDYTSYVHLVDHQSQGLSQHDHRPGGEFYPSHYWQPGEILRDQHPLIIPPGLAPGDYQLRVGMYIQTQPGVIQSMGDGVIIGQVKVRS